MCELCNKGRFFSRAKEKVLERDFIEITLTCEDGDVCCHSHKSDRDCLVLIKCGTLDSEAPRSSWVLNPFLCSFGIQL